MWNSAGCFGTAVEAGHRGRLTTFIRDQNSKPVALFSPEARAANTQGDWYGEHAGKWLYTAARAVYRLRDGALLAAVRRVVGSLAAWQEADGYLGTYSPATRMTSQEAYGKRTWHVWVHSYLVLGFLEVHRYWPNDRYLAVARRIGDLCVRLFTRGDKSVAYMGSHMGLSGTILMEPMVGLFHATGEARYLELAELILKQAGAARTQIIEFRP